MGHTLKTEQEWPIMPELENSILKKGKTTCTLKQADSSIFENISNVNYLIRKLSYTTAYCRRLINNCKQRDKRTSVLTVAELTEALHTLARLSQAQSSAEIQVLRNNQEII